MTTQTERADEATTPSWQVLLEHWCATGKITEEDGDAMANLITDEIWARERYGYALGRAYRGRMAHGG
jgi:hypothetical protein